MNAISEKKNNERGAATIIEMTLIFPLVLVAVLTLFVLAMYILHTVTAYSAAQIIATAAAREIQMPGYTELYGSYENVSFTPDFKWSKDEAIDDATVNKVMEHHDPYRYWNFGNMLSDGSESMLENGFRKLWESSGFLSGGTVNCDITTENRFLVQYVNVKVTQTVKLPSFVKIIGLKDRLEMSVGARAVVSDSGEFVRNTDMVLDLADYLWNELKFGSDSKTLSDRVSVFGDKIKAAKEKLGWK